MKLSLRPRCNAVECPHEPSGYMVLRSGKRVAVCDSHGEHLKSRGYDVVDIAVVLERARAEEQVMR